MFAYCNNNPVNYCDESGSYSTCCTLVADSGGGNGYPISNRELYDEFQKYYSNWVGEEYSFPVSLSERVIHMQVSTSQTELTKWNRSGIYIMRNSVEYLCDAVVGLLVGSAYVAAALGVISFCRDCLVSGKRPSIYDIPPEGTYIVYEIKAITTKECCTAQLSANGEPYVDYLSAISTQTFFVDQANPHGVYLIESSYLTIAP